VAALALLAAVAFAHLLAGEQFLSSQWVGQWGGHSGASEPAPRRIDVAFVRELAPAAPPVVVAAPAPRPAPAPSRRAARPRPAASAPEPAPLPAAGADPAPATAAEPEAAASAPPLASPAPEPTTLADAATAPLPASAAAGASTAANAVAVAAPASSAAGPDTAAPAFAWPPSTQLNYALTGYYRGDVLGTATVEWIREGSHYQVHLRALVGVEIAPLMARRLSSDGQLGEAGLVPQRFDGEQRVGFSTRRWSLKFVPGRATLADGREVGTSAGVQDEASQFVQLAWLFTTQPQLLRAGQAVDLQLALPRRVSTWTYEVQPEEPLQLPFGTLPAYQLKPRREGRAGELTAQIWIAPTLQYLPVRIRIHQDDANYVDLMLKRPPLQALR
jgi:hypothetical protein